MSFFKFLSTAERSVQEVLALSPLQELEDKRAETDFAAALCGLTILRYLGDHVTSLPLGLMSRLLGAHDAVMALLPLVEAPPWVRSSKGGKVGGGAAHHAAAAAVSSASALDRFVMHQVCIRLVAASAA